MDWTDPRTDLEKRIDNRVVRLRATFEEKLCTVREGMRTGGDYTIDFLVRPVPKRQGNNGETKGTKR